MSAFRSIEWLDEGVVRMIDQRKLPHTTVYNDYTDYQTVAQAITDMVIRGAPAIGAAAAYGMALTAFHSDAVKVADLKGELETADGVLRKSRPTAVNLFWALDRMSVLISNNFETTAGLAEAILAEAVAQHEITTRDTRLLAWQFVAIVEASLSPYARDQFANSFEMAVHLTNIFFDGVGERTTVVT